MPYLSRKRGKERFFVSFVACYFFNPGVYFLRLFVCFSSCLLQQISQITLRSNIVCLVFPCILCWFVILLPQIYNFTEWSYNVSKKFRFVPALHPSNKFQFFLEKMTTFFVFNVYMYFDRSMNGGTLLFRYETRRMVLGPNTTMFYDAKCAFLFSVFLVLVVRGMYNWLLFIF